jgi:glycosyltransferase involved in cell wall biosynthesis
MIRLLYVVSHPIQYQAPLLRRIASEPGIALRVLFERMPDGGLDSGFAQEIRWDVPLLEGYEHALLSPAALSAGLRWADVVWVHGWQGWRMKSVLLAARVAGVPVLMRGENWLGAMPHAEKVPAVLKRGYLNAVFGLCAGFLTIGTANRDYYRSLGVASDRLFPMPYAVNNAFFAARAATPAPERARQALGLPADRPVILFAGKLIRRKHPHTLMAAWKEAFPNADERPALVDVGNGEMADHLRREAPPGAYFLGFRNQSELPPIYALADVFVLAAEREAWGLAINEAMACGTAVIAGTQCGATRDLIDADVGAVVEPGDVTALADALHRVLPNADAMGSRARARVAGWSFDEDLAGLRRALDTLLPGRRGAP